MMNRRRLLIALGTGAFARPSIPLAQQSAKVYRIGFLGLASAITFKREVESLQSGLRELGYIDGKNAIIEYRWAEGKYDRLPALAAELVRLKVDVIVTQGVPGTRAAKQATNVIPIVIARTSDPVATGLVASLARPGGNVTGISSFSSELNAKRLELLKDAIPNIRRVGVLFNVDNPNRIQFLRAMEEPVRHFKLTLQQFGVHGPADFEAAFASMSKQRTEAVVIAEDGILFANVQAAVDIANRQNLPSLGFIEVAEAGGLMAYGVDSSATYRRSAYLVDKILKGAKPGDIPIERASKFEIVINLKTARALRIKLPDLVLQRADRVIE